MADVEEERTAGPESAPQGRPSCRFFSQGKHCHFGRKCRFVHDREEASHPPEASPPQPQRPPESSRPPQPQPQRAPESSRPPQPQPQRAPESSRPAAPTRRPCRYFLSGFCSQEERCRFWHPAPALPATDPPARPHASAPARGPAVQDLKLSELTEEMVQQLRRTEIEQLKKRFPKDQLIVQEREDGRVTYYRATVEATDPDWPFDLKEIEIMVCFPENYPVEIFLVEIPLDQQLPAVMARHVQEASVQWLQAKHATNQLLGKVELLFRPFLRWLDRSLERLFTEGAKQLKKDLDVEKAGLQFIPYQELQVTVCEKQESVPEQEEDGPESEEEEEEAVSRDCEEEGPTRLVENISLRGRPRGTELQLLGLKLGQDTATIVANNITVCLRCNRCKVSAELSLSGSAPCAAQCEKCSAEISVAFAPCVLHHYSHVLGYLQLHSASACDLLLRDCLFTAGCLSCSQETRLDNLSYGQTKDFHCDHCHTKLSIEAEGAKFHLLQPPSRKTGAQDGGAQPKNVRDPAVQKGKPLPDRGTCRHYKHSHRWLRFPCCGRAYPCDVCHDENQDHPMELATRMICGFCAKEQSYGNGKPCVSCGSMMTKASGTSHWEGGLGCRNRVKMSRNDRQKYANTNKTVSRKAASDKK